MLLAFLAGAAFMADAVRQPEARGGDDAARYTGKDILYTARTSILAESTLATPAVIGPPQEETARRHQLEARVPALPRRAARPHRPVQGARRREQLQRRRWSAPASGCATRTATAPTRSIGTVQGRIFYQNDARAMKPVMTVLYAGSNLALHAFRAGSSVTQAITTACDTTLPAATAIRDQEARGQGRNCGGEELWAFVPYDQLGKIANRYINNPQKRDPHDFVIARGIRFSDVFVPTPGTAANPDDIADRQDRRPA